jgi:hypothetical protein
MRFLRFFLFLIAAPNYLNYVHRPDHILRPVGDHPQAAHPVAALGAATQSTAKEPKLI